MKAILGFQMKYLDEGGPMNDVLFKLKRIVVSDGESLISIVKLGGHVHVLMDGQSFLDRCYKQLPIEIPDDFVKRVIEAERTQKELFDQLSVLMQ